jgi:hypothetical protein
MISSNKRLICKKLYVVIRPEIHQTITLFGYAKIGLVEKKKKKDTKRTLMKKKHKKKMLL